MHGSTWTRQGKPSTLPATYRRLQGVRNFLAFYDVHQDILWGYFRQRKRRYEVLDVLKRLRKRYPLDQRIYLVLDNFSPHRCANILQWAQCNNVKLVWTPTNASWLNRIECQFTEVKKFVFENTFYQHHHEVTEAMSKFLCYRNKRNRKHKKTFK